MRKSTLTPLLLSFPILQPPPTPPPFPAQGPPHTTNSLAVTLDGFSEMRPCPGGSGRLPSSFSSSASSHDAFLRLSQGWSLISLHSSARFQLPHQQLCQRSRKGGRSYISILSCGPASRFVSGKLSVKSAPRQINTHTRARWLAFQISAQFSPFGRISLLLFLLIAVCNWVICRCDTIPV